MYKRLCLLCCLVLFVAAGIPFTKPLTVRGEESSFPPAEMLIVYNNNPSQEVMSGVQSIVEIVTYLQHSVVFASVDECLPVLNNYDSIICYNLTGVSDSFMNALAGSGKAVFIAGGDIVKAYIDKKGYPINSTEYKDATASVHYEFSEKRNYNTLTDFNNGYLLTGTFRYKTGTVSVAGVSSGLYAGYGSLLYTPVTDFNDSLILASFTDEVAQWLWPYNGKPHTYAQYIVLNEVYPYTNAETLMKVIEYLTENKLPFIISVMPVYQNGEYPAMVRFCEILRYAQAGGGAVIMHAPITLREDKNVDLIWQYLTTATEAYTNYGVYPLGIQVPEGFMFTETSREIIRRYSTIFWYKEEGEPTVDLSEHYNSIYSDGHNMIGSSIYLDNLLSNQIMVHSTATYIDMNESFDMIKEQLEEKKTSGIPFKNLWEIDNSVYANSLYLHTTNGQIYFNNEKKSLDYVPFVYDKNYDYNNSVFHWIAMDLAGLNEILVVIVIISSLLFTFFIIRARQFNKKKFLYTKEREQKK
jgi:uncharacterized protein YdaL